MLPEGVLFQIVSNAGVNIGTFLLIIPIAMLMLRKLPLKEPKEQKSIDLIGLVSFLFIGLGIVCMTVLLRITATGFRQSVIVQPQGFSVVLLIPCIIAAVAEELLFRGILLNRLKPFGNKEAILISVLGFGLCHINFWSFLFAFALGLLWGQIVVHTNKIRYSIILHTASNILVVSLLPFAFNKMPEIMINTICVAFILLGAILFLIRRKSIRSLGDTDKGIGIRAVLMNPGAMIFLVVSICAMVMLFVLQI